jgi:ectoine hydroxylase-related dioxygenase (phytanoyl-CoA dioxygenase family)/2-polyprenyl-3-methyl-5-hydroxy-6-metoxy-1,4-benzoquinol methylase
VRPLLRDPAARQLLERDGFVVVPLLSSRQVEWLRRLYAEHVGDEEVAGLFESSRKKPYAVNRLIADGIHDHVKLAGADTFLPCVIHGGTFMVKSSRASEVLPLHQDWSVVDEERHRTLFLWCPLVDVTARNGALFVVPGSHRYFRSIRSGSYASDRYVLPPELHKYVKDVPMRAGEAILYSDALFHGSHANHGPEDRVVATARIMEEGASLVYFHRATETAVDVYQADPEFYLRHIDVLARGSLPPGASRLCRRAYQHVPVTDAALRAKIRQHGEMRDQEYPMRQLFRDPLVQEQFEANGFAVIDLLDAWTTDKVTAFYAQLRNAPTPESGFQVSLDNEDPEFVRTVAEELIGAVRTAVERHLTDYQIFTASFVTKEPNPLGLVPPHQDWTFVDESRFWSATIWCPLEDVSVESGALALLKGSHRLYDEVRPSPSPQYTPPFKSELSLIFPYMTPVELTAGRAVVFDNRTLHASPPNASNRTRVAFGLGVTHRDATLRHYYLLPGQTKRLIEGYEVTADFFLRYNNKRLAAMYERGERPRDLANIGTFALDSDHREPEELMIAIQVAGNTENSALKERVALLGEPRASSSERKDLGGSPVPERGGRRWPWQVYTPGNVAREIEHRLNGRGFFETYSVRNIKAELLSRASKWSEKRRALRALRPGAGLPRYDGRHAGSVGRFYDTHHASFMKVYGDVIQAFRTKNVRDLLDYEMRSMGLRPGLRVLDAGCGVAAPAAYFARHAGVHVDAITISRVQWDAARRRIASENLSDKVTVVLGDYHRLDDHFTKGAYDVVYFLESLGHSRAKEHVVRVCWEMLKPGGTLYIKDLFARVPLRPEHKTPILREIRKINAAYRYQVASLNALLDDIRRAGFILASLKTVDLDLAAFEDLAISNEFQKLTGIASIENWDRYVFPVDFFEVICVKPEFAPGERLDRHFLQTRYHRQDDGN